MDPGKSVAMEIRYEVRIQRGPWKFKIAGIEHEIRENRDRALIFRMTMSGRVTFDEKIVGIIGDEHETGCREFLNLRDFLIQGGVIGLHRDLA